MRPLVAKHAFFITEKQGGAGNCSASPPLGCVVRQIFQAGGLYNATEGGQDCGESGVKQILGAIAAGLWGIAQHRASSQPWVTLLRSTTLRIVAAHAEGKSGDEGIMGSLRGCPGLPSSAW